MLSLDLPAEPYWLDLPRGVRVGLRPVTTAVMAAAQAAAARRLGALRAASEDLDPGMARLGLPGQSAGPPRRHRLGGGSATPQTCRCRSPPRPLSG
jgi:hypothetical protein